MIANVLVFGIRSGSFFVHEMQHLVLSELGCFEVDFLVFVHVISFHVSSSKSPDSFRL